ncbi:hypothetical protein BH09CHL1_BH09CHL1_00330 [soil metagenome]
MPNDATVAEIGAGTGYFVVRLDRVFNGGKVIGIDTEPQMVAYLRKRVAELGLTNVDTRLVRPSEAIPLDEQVDLLLCADTYHHIPDRDSLFSNYAKHLKQGGKLVIIDRPLNAPEGPPSDLRLSAETVVEERGEPGLPWLRAWTFFIPISISSRSR